MDLSHSIFFEAVAVGEYRCEPEQSGFTIPEEAVRRPQYTSAFNATGLAGHDGRVTTRSCYGWYWSVLPVILVGITVRYVAFGAMHGLFRAQQTKKPLRVVMQQDKRTFFFVIAYVIIFLALFVLATWTFLRDVPFPETEETRQGQQEERTQEGTSLMPSFR